MLNPHRTRVLGLYRRAMQLSGPYVDSEGVQDFMRREIMQEMKTKQKATRDELLIAEESLTREALLEACKDNVRTLFQEQKDVKNTGQIENLIRQGNVELDAVEDKIIRQQKKFGMIKDKEHIKYVTN